MKLNKEDKSLLLFLTPAIAILFTGLYVYKHTERDANYEIPKVYVEDWLEEKADYIIKDTCDGDSYNPYTKYMVKTKCRDIDIIDEQTAMNGYKIYTYRIRSFK